MKPGKTVLQTPKPSSEPPWPLSPGQLAERMMAEALRSAQAERETGDSQGL